MKFGNPVLLLCDQHFNVGRFTNFGEELDQLVVVYRSLAVFGFIVVTSVGGRRTDSCSATARDGGYRVTNDIAFGPVHRGKHWKAHFLGLAWP